MHKKGADGEKRVLKKTRKANTFKSRGVFGASIEEIKKKRDQSAAARATARAKALRCDSPLPHALSPTSLRAESSWGAPPTVPCRARALATSRPRTLARLRAQGCPDTFVRALSLCSDAKAKKAAKAKTAKASARHNQGGSKAQYVRPASRGAKGKAVTGRGK